MSPETSLVLLLLINSFLIASGSGFQLRSRWLATMTTTKHVGRSGATGYQPQQQQHPFGMHMPRGGSSDVVLDLLAVDDDEDEDAAEDDDDDEDDDGGETQVESVRNETDEPLEENNIEVEDKIVDDDGSKATSSELDNNEDQEEKATEDEDEDEDEDEEEPDGPPVATSSQPINIMFKTNMGNPLIDTSLELLVSRSRTVENVKQSLSRMLPGRPPPEVMRLVSEGILLRDDELINDVVDDDEDLDDEDEEASTVTMLLDMVPPVDPKFATQLQNMNEVSTSDLLDAYAANSAAMYHPTNDVDQQGDLLSVQLRHEAHTIREQLLETFPEKSLAALYAETLSSEFVEDRRGQRYRTSMGGARANLKRILQTNLNIVSAADWSHCT